MEAIKKPLSKKRGDVNLTEGNIWWQIITFAIPLLLGNLFQQLYNMVDTWVVGNFVSDAAFAAVGTVAPIINTLIGFFMGLSSGAGVVISQAYGRSDMIEVKRTVIASVIMTLAMGVAFTVIGVSFTPMMLDFINTPDEVTIEATTYLRIYFAGVMGLMIYNMGAGILRAVGDSKRPFYFLVVSALTNIVLDLLFVLVFGMGVAGVAYATIISQIISAILVTVVLLKTSSPVKLVLSELKHEFLHIKELLPIFKKIVRVGIPAALQMAITAFSNVFIQSYINFFGKECMAGYTAYAKIDAILFMPMQSLALSATTFVGQNLGAEKPHRAKKGSDIALILAIVSTLVMGIPVMVFAPQLVTFFIDVESAVSYGTMFLRFMTPFYLLCTINQVYSGSLRGSGNSRAPMIIMLTSFVLFRQAYMFIMANFISNTIIPIVAAYPAGWALSSILTIIVYLRSPFVKNSKEQRTAKS
jgi:putative MATE family efflux protein